MIPVGYGFLEHWKIRDTDIVQGHLGTWKCFLFVGEKVPIHAKFVWEQEYL